MTHAVVSSAGMRIIRLLVGNPPQNVANLIEAAGVTRTAVTEQLNELVAGGFVERMTQRLAGRGRPRHVYKATNTALLLLFANNQRLVVPAMWQAIEEVGGAKLTRQVLGAVSRALAEHYSRKITATEPRKRLRQLTDILRSEGGLLDIEESSGQVVVRKRSCPFISMLDDSRNVCCIDQEMMTAIVGRPVRRVACRHDDDSPCCEFELVPARKRG